MKTSKILAALFLAVFSFNVVAQQIWSSREQYPSSGGVVVVVYNLSPYEIYCEITTPDGGWVDFLIGPADQRGPRLSQPYRFYSKYIVRCQ